MEHAFDKRCMQKHLHELWVCIHGIVAKAIRNRVWIFYERDEIQPEYPSSWKSKIYEIHIVINHNVFIKGLFLMQMKSLQSLAKTSNWIRHAVAMKPFTWAMSYTGELTILHAHVVIKLKDVGQGLQQKYSENGVGGSRRTCKVKASNSLFGNPCVGTFKYLIVAYKCYSEYHN